MFRPLLILLTALGTLGWASCGTGGPAYVDRVRPLDPDKAHPFVQELLPLLKKALSRGEADDLVRTWKHYVQAQGLPLRKDDVTTFVYYDFGQTSASVSLEATFAPGRTEALTRIEGTALWVGVYQIPDRGDHLYRFVTEKGPQADPFAETLAVGASEGPWHRVQPKVETGASRQGITARSEADLGTRDFSVWLPPGYQVDLGRTYPVVVLWGTEDPSWEGPLAQALENQDLSPLVVADLGTEPWSKADLEERLVPWLRHNFRLNLDPTSLVAAGLGTQAKAAADLVASRPDFWGKAVTTLDPKALAILFPVVNP